MSKYIYFIIIILITHLLFLILAVSGYSFEKIILIDQKKQEGRAYDNGKEILKFPVLTGDNEICPTEPGSYIVKLKDKDYYSHTYKAPMRYSLFFNLKAMKAIHEGQVAHNAKDRKELRTRGCINVEEPYIKELYDWAEVGNTLVIIQGWRTEEIDVKEKLPGLKKGLSEIHELRHPDATPPGPREGTQSRSTGISGQGGGPGSRPHLLRVPLFPAGYQFIKPDPGLRALP